MRIVADTHVHLYPFYDRDAALGGAFARLAALDPKAGIRAVCLTERADCHAFRELPGDRVETGALRWRGEGAGENWIFAGRQVATLERLEVLALTVDAEIPDGLALDETVKRVREAGGSPVLAWAPGKWFFERGTIIRKLIDAAEPGQLLLGDTSLRPTVWCEPCLMKKGRRRGIRIVAGSDPLPVPGEESYAGTYAIRVESTWDSSRPVTSMRNLLIAEQADLIGRRCGLLETLGRLKKNKGAKAA